MYGWFCLVAQITLGIHVLQKELSLIVHVLKMLMPAEAILTLIETNSAPTLCT